MSYFLFWVLHRCAQIVTIEWVWYLWYVYFSVYQSYFSKKQTVKKKSVFERHLLSATDPGTGDNIMNIPDNSPALVEAAFSGEWRRQMCAVKESWCYYRTAAGQWLPHSLSGSFVVAIVVFQFFIQHSIGVIFHSVSKSFFRVLLLFKICNAFSFLGCLLISKWF